MYYSLHRKRGSSSKISSVNLNKFANSDSLEKSVNKSLIFLFSDFIIKFKHVLCIVSLAYYERSFALHLLT